MSKRPKVLLIAAANATSGGGEKHVADLLRRLPGEGVEVSLVCPPGGDLTALADELGVPLAPVPIQGGVSIGQVADVRRVIAETSPDVVHAHGSRAALFARIADSGARRRCLYTLHGIHADKAGSPFRRAGVLGVERALRPRTARFVAVCEADLEKGARLGVLAAERSTVVFNGIDLPAEASADGSFRAELGLPGCAQLVLSVGRFHEQKDQATLLRAWRTVIARHPDAVLALVGAGELEGHLREVARAQGLGDSIRFVAPRSSLDRAYADADAFALSSRWEGLPYVVLEAMSFGKPVVATAVDGVPEAVVEGETGLLVPSGDERAFADSLARVLGDKELSDRMGEAGRRRVLEHFSLDGMITGLLDAYERVIADPAGEAAR